MFKRQPWWRSLTIFLVLIVMITTAIIASASEPFVHRPWPNREIRGVWLTNIDSDVLFSRSALTQGLDRLAKLHFNTVYPTVWNWGYTLYPSEVAKREIGVALDPVPGLQGRDMLQEVIDQGHQRGMAVIPWFEFGFMLPADSELVKRHPDWITRRRDGSTIWKEGEHDRVWLNPFHPEVQKFIQDLILEIVTKYDIDGIQVDDHFGLPVDFGYDNFTTRLYRQQDQRDWVVQMLQGSPPKKPEAWVDWRAYQITSFMEQLFHAIKAKKPDCLVSVSPNPQHFSKNKYLLDWETWERRGYVEELLLQIYRPDLDRFAYELKKPEVEAARLHIPVGIGILSGLKNRSTPMEMVQAQVEETRRRGFAGVSFFFYESLWQWGEPEHQRESALQSLFPAPIQRPSL